MLIFTTKWSDKWIKQDHPIRETSHKEMLTFGETTTSTVCVVLKCNRGTVIKNGCLLETSKNQVSRLSGFLILK
jgi:hypothetical protein